MPFDVIILIVTLKLFVLANLYNGFEYDYKGCVHDGKMLSNLDTIIDIEITWTQCISNYTLTIISIKTAAIFYLCQLYMTQLSTVLCTVMELQICL